jgi:menaquinone-dependent protoporphyrinogen oxidase
MKEAAQFVREHRELLAAHPTWLFSSGPVGTDLVDAKGRNVLETSEPMEFAEFVELIGPRADRVFFGAYDPDNPPADLAERVVRLMPPIKKLLPTGDFRDWAEIEAWAEGIARELRTAKTAATNAPVPA